MGCGFGTGKESGDGQSHRKGGRRGRRLKELCHRLERGWAGTRESWKEIKGKGRVGEFLILDYLFFPRLRETLTRGLRRRYSRKGRKGR